MQTRFVAIIFAVCTASIFVIPQSPAPAEPQQAETIDFVALRAQAAAALNTLQESHKHRVASAARTGF
jgi:hypothetical protein